MRAPGADRTAAQAVGERLRKAVAAIDLRPGGHAGIPLTTSIGVAVYPDDAGTAGELLAAADKALYEANRGGGNHVALAGAATGRDGALPVGQSAPEATAPDGPAPHRPPGDAWW